MAGRGCDWSRLAARQAMAFDLYFKGPAERQLSRLRLGGSRLSVSRGPDGGVLALPLDVPEAEVRRLLERLERMRGEGALEMGLTPDACTPLEEVWRAYLSARSLGPLAAERDVDYTDDGLGPEAHRPFDDHPRDHLWYAGRRPALTTSRLFYLLVPLVPFVAFILFERRCSP